MTNPDRYEQEYEDEDPCNIEEDDPEEKAELIRIISLGMFIQKDGHNTGKYSQFAKHVRMTRFIKYICQYMIENGYVKKICPSVLCKIKH